MKNDKDPIQFQNQILKSSVSTENLESVIALSIGGNTEQERKENAKRVATLVAKFFKQKVDHCEYSTRKIFGGSRSWISKNNIGEVVIGMWDKTYKQAVSNRLYTCATAYELIAEELSSDYKISKRGVENIIITHNINKRASR